MSKTENVFIRVEPQVKENAEAIFEELGISMSNAVGIFLHQVILNHGFPFELKIPYEKPIAFDSLSDQEVEQLFEEAMQEYKEGKVLSEKNVRSILKRIMKE